MQTIRSRAGSLVSQLVALCERHAALLLLGVACLTRFPGLGLPEPGLDESWSWHLVQQIFSTNQFLKNLGIDAPLFVGINLAIAERFGLSVLGLRLPQAIFGAASVPLLFLLLRSFLSTRLAFLSGLLAALSPYLIFHSRQARPYAQLLFFALLFTYAFYRSTPWGSERRRRVVLCVCTFLAVASHYYSLVYFAAFYAVVLAAHAVAGRRRELRNDLITGALSLALVAPLIVLLAVVLSRYSLPYWKWQVITLPGVVAEQFLFLMVGPASEWMNFFVSVLLLLPLLHAVRRNRQLIRSYPVVALVWLVAPGAMVLLGWLLGRDLLFYPRGFIPCAPFLLAYWVLFTDSMNIGRWSKRVYIALLMVPFLLFSVVMSHPDQPYFKHRGTMAEIVRNAKDHSEEFDLIIVHHWIVTHYFAYYYPEKEKVRGLGALLRREAAERGEKVAILKDLVALPGDARLLLVLNEVATDHVDPRGEVLQLLFSTRPMIREFPCRDVTMPGDTLLCSRMIIFGAVSYTQ